MLVVSMAELEASCPASLITSQLLLRKIDEPDMPELSRKGRQEVR